MSIFGKKIMAPTITATITDRNTAPAEIAEVKTAWPNSIIAGQAQLRGYRQQWQNTPKLALPGQGPVFWPTQGTVTWLSTFNTTLTWKYESDGVYSYSLDWARFVQVYRTLLAYDTYRRVINLNWSQIVADSEILANRQHLG